MQNGRAVGRVASTGTEDKAQYNHVLWNPTGVQQASWNVANY